MDHNNTYVLCKSLHFPKDINDWRDFGLLVPLMFIHEAGFGVGY